MTGSDWKHPHIIMLAAATVLAFGGGYWVGQSRGRAAGVAPLVISNELTTAPAPRARPDENTLVAENAEPEEPASRSRPAPPARVEPLDPPEPPVRPEPRPRPRDREPDFSRGDPDDPDLVDPGIVGEKPET